MLSIERFHGKVQLWERADLGDHDVTKCRKADLSDQSNTKQVGTLEQIFTD